MAIFNLIRCLPPEMIAGVVTNRPGELASCLPAHIPLRNMEVYQTVFPGGRGSAANRMGAYLLWTEQRFLDAIRRRFPADLWVVNTLTWPGVVGYAEGHKIPLVVQVCELESQLANLTPDQLEQLVRAPRLMIAISAAVAAMLRALGRTDGVELCPPALDTAAIVAGVPVAEMRRRLGFPSDAFIWAMAGTLDPNKNPSLFVDLAERVIAARPNCRFIWIKGGTEINGYQVFCRMKARSRGLADRIVWTDTVRSDYYAHLGVCDAFVLPSARESFSLVSAEALWLGKPVAAFDCGGVVDVVPAGGGIIVRPYDTDALVTAMLRIVDGGFAFDAAGARRAIGRCDQSVVAARWQELIAAYFGVRAAPATVTAPRVSLA